MSDGMKYFLFILALIGFYIPIYLLLDYLGLKESGVAYIAELIYFVLFITAYSKLEKFIKPRIEKRRQEKYDKKFIERWKDINYAYRMHDEFPDYFDQSINDYPEIKEHLKEFYPQWFE